MDFRDSLADAAFRAEARAWLDAHAPRRADDSQEGIVTLLSEAGDDHELVSRHRAWQRTLYEGGWAAITWPRAYGGRDATVTQAFIWSQELSRYDVPPNLSQIGIGLIGPTLIVHGTPEQKARYLPPMASGEEIWCQLWSEPGAGSDLASLRTRARRDPGGDWLLSGQKVWTSGAQYADLGLIVARTDPDLPKHRGLSVFIVDMHAPGVTVRPLRQMTGGANFNEVFLDDVRVPAENLVGEVNDGWRVALTTLMNERVGVAGFDPSRLVEPLLALARKAEVGGRPLLEDPVFRQQVAAAFVRARLLTLTSYRSLTRMARGSVPGPEGSILKLVWSAVVSEVAEVGARMLGPQALRLDPGAPERGLWARSVLFAPGTHIGGGTDEVQRNVIGERVLGLPREPQVDRDVPFRELEARGGRAGPQGGA